MMKKRFAFCSILLFILAGVAFAHTPILLCWDNGDGTVTCEGGFSDGSSAKGVEMRVEDENKKVLIKGVMDKNNEFTFKKPDCPFIVVFDAGPGHIIKIKSSKIK